MPKSHWHEVSTISGQRVRLGGQCSKRSKTRSELLTLSVLVQTCVSDGIAIMACNESGGDGPVPLRNHVAGGW
jgi:hypothetical protein